MKDMKQEKESGAAAYKQTKEKVKKYIRYKEGAELYSMGMSSFQKLAREAGAVYKIDKIALVNTEILEAYLEAFRLPPN